jgi:hypothetical protein
MRFISKSMAENPREKQLILWFRDSTDFEWFRMIPLSGISCFPLALNDFIVILSESRWLHIGSDWFQMILMTLVVLRILRILNDSDNFKWFRVIPDDSIVWNWLFAYCSAWFRVIPYWFWMILDDSLLILANSKWF